MNRCTAWCVPFATLALSTAANAADPGFYFGATASRVEHEVEGLPGVPVLVINTFTPPPFFGGIRPTPNPGVPLNPFLPPVSGFIAPTSTDIDEVDSGFSATVGYRVNRYLAAELSYHDFGEYQQVDRYDFGDITYELGVRGPSVSVLGSLPLGDRWELFLRGGVLFADQKVSLNIINGPPNRDYSDEVILAGAGVQWSFAPRWAARVEYQRTDDMKYDDAGESSIDQASLSVFFKL